MFFRQNTLTMNMNEDEKYNDFIILRLNGFWDWKETIDLCFSAGLVACKWIRTHEYNFDENRKTPLTQSTVSIAEIPVLSQNHIEWLVIKRGSSVKRRNC